MKRPEEFDPFGICFVWFVGGLGLVMALAVVLDAVVGSSAAQVGAGIVAIAFLLIAIAAVIWWWWPSLMSARQPEDTPGWSKEGA